MTYTHEETRQIHLALKIVGSFVLAFFFMLSWGAYFEHRKEAYQHASLSQNPWGIESGMTPMKVDEILTSFGYTYTPLKEDSPSFARNYHHSKNQSALLIGFKSKPNTEGHKIDGLIIISGPQEFWFLRWLPFF